MGQTSSHTVSRQGARSMAQVSLFAALMAVLGLIPKIDLPLGVPITIQSLGVMLAGVMLGPWRGLQSMLLFLAAVAVGLPLLSGGRGGIGAFLAPSAGYLLGFALAACITGAVMAALPQSTPRRTAISAFIASLLGGLLCMHASGVLGLMLLANMSLAQAFKVTLVFVPGDIIKCILCAIIVHTVARGMPDWRFGGRR
ncbi:biotin transporter BioY [Comamonas sp. Y33R10-2]|uniref:biotin transporter BioY n=1 Tax=Comamonas sp. Y33R10-2 TaxID=2853257 RepID=UPI001C5C9327|nr:biotin transporter BioY [Comamonas sp. Y33R10-2]QXZ10863.1 biotin transporter BioY [Comamonas sp. Y33R10-2]